MKTKLLFSILLLFMQLSFLRAEGWEYVGSLTQESMRKVTTQGLDTVFVVGYNGLIAKSTDRGLTWNKQYVESKMALRDILFVTYTIGFAVGDKGVIIKTTDAGTSWTKLTSGTTYLINAIAATGLNNIWAVGDSSLVLHSTDAGQSWQKVSLTSTLTYFNDIEFKNGNGFIIGNPGVIFRTQNAGNSWDIVTTIENSNPGDYFYSLSMTESNAFVRRSLTGGGQMLVTTDNTIWKSKPFSLWGHETGMYFNSNNIGYMATVNFTTCGCGPGFAQVYKTTNSGTDWMASFVGAGNGVSEFKFANDTIGYFLTDVALYRTPANGSFYLKQYNGLENKYVQPVITLKQQDNYLIVGSTDKTISVIELRSLIGARLYSTKTADKEPRINVSQIPQGVYVVHTIFADNSSSAVKWIRQ
jgi:photosystem II stability/assembly factor-like uncharacterized protein